MIVPSPLDVRIIGNLSPPDWWTIGLTGGAVILGAIIGAAISWIVAKQAARDNRKIAETVRRSGEEAATLRAITKIMELVNAAAGYHFQVEKEISEAKRQTGKDYEAWQVMVARVGRPHEVYITADDLIAFTRSRKFDYVTDLLHLVSQYNSMIFGFEAYSKRRDELNSMLTPDRIDGRVGSMAATPEQMLKIAPYVIGVRDVADSLRQEAKEVYETSAVLAQRFGPIVRSYFNDPKFPVPSLIADPNTQTEAKVSSQA